VSIISNPSHWNDHDEWMRIQQQIDRINRRTPPPMGIGEATAKAAVDVSHFRVEAIENGFIIAYSCMGQGERRRYAPDTTSLAEQITAAVVEMKLRGTQAQGG
jgi:hypothetical protein